MKNVIVLIISFLTISLFALNSSAQNLCTDPPGTKDSHYVKRYEGSCIIGYDFNNYDRVEIPLAYVSRDANREWKPEKSLVVEGAHTRILYAGPENRSSLEVFQNYEKALATAGYNNLYECEGDECSSGCKLGTFYLYPGKKQLRNKGNMTQYALKKVESQYFGVFKGTDQGKEIYISVYTVQNKDDYIVKELYNRSVTILDVVEVEPMETGKVQAEDIQKGLEENGSISIYGIHFDHGESTIKEESKETLATIATYLNSIQEKIFIVGHTDNTGTLEINLDLSLKRAEAVVEKLTQEYNVNPEQLSAKGVGPFAPKASNSTENGRALNRRVEIVLR